jgi:glycosyltransferase involved in cell wall biosynthesis
MSIEIDQYCHRQKIPYVRLIQNAGERWWPNDSSLDVLTEAYLGAAACCFVSEGNQRLVETQMGVRFPNAHVVWNAPVVWPATPLRWPDDSANLNLACVGRLEPDAKGQDLLFRVLSKPQWKQRPIRVSVIGSGQSGKAVRKLAEMLGLNEPALRFQGTVSDITKVWLNHHALILPSREEGMPLAALEAMACGRVPILTAVAGNPELVVDNKTGFLAAAPTFQFVDEAMERAWHRRIDWQSMGEAAAVSLRRLLPIDPGVAFANLVSGLVR